jgi:hypothetical protein
VQIFQYDEIAFLKLTECLPEHLVAVNRAHRDRPNGSAQFARHHHCQQAAAVSFWSDQQQVRYSLPLPIGRVQQGLDRIENAGLANEVPQPVWSGINMCNS